MGFYFFILFHIYGLPEKLYKLKVNANFQFHNKDVENETYIQNNLLGNCNCDLHSSLPCCLSMGYIY